MKWPGWLGRKAGKAPPSSHGSRELDRLCRDELTGMAVLEPGPLYQALKSGPQGLPESEALERLRRTGRNAVAQERTKSAAAQLLERIANPLNILLLLMAAVSLMTGGAEAAAIITLMVVLSVSLSFVQERRSNRAAAALRAMVHTTASVLRLPSSEADTTAQGGGEGAPDSALSTSREVPIEQLVPGDVIHLSAGDMVPADVRVLTAKDLFVNEASLTGEALPVEKFAMAEAAGTAVMQLRNTCFMGTDVTSGTASAIVVHTGARAVFGGIANAIAGERELTSFDRGVTRFTWLMIRFIVVMAPLVFLINGVTKGDWLQALLFATAVAVGLTPEMLPMLVTVNLSKGAMAMSRKKVIVKRLNAIQNFGAMDVLCTDKTGTLTQDRIILEKYVGLDGNDSDKVLEYAYLNSYYQSGLKNLLDVAVLKYSQVHEKLHRSGNFHKVDEIPFDFLRRRMSVIVDGQGGRLLICKGAVEEVFAVCTHGEVDGRRFALDDSHLDALQAESKALNEDGLRVLSIAVKPIESGQCVFSMQDESDLTLLGYVAFLDPPKESVRGALTALAGHGVDVKILTGDNELVTRKVCREVGLQVDRVVLGSELEKLGPDALGEMAESAQVFAKLSPAQKALVIEALHRKGHVVGYLGDGINDGPALKAADIGISVDTAVDIAKESADIILLEKSLLVLDEGVIEGRKVFGNILKYIRMGASSNFGNMFSVLGASAWLPFLPMAPIQVLTNNLLYDFSQTAIPTDNIDPEFLDKPRRWEIGNIARFMLFVGPVSSFFDYVTFGVMYAFFHAQTVGQAALFQTGWFVESLLSQTLVIHVIRTSRTPFIQSRASTPLILTSIAICATGVWLPCSPLAATLGFVSLPPMYWPILVVILAAYLTLTFLMKRWFHRSFGVG
ncbi:MAG TPA: magnesium-translocating P-type ATPase [Lysobacter sp.]|nr:magnesium-translocating P-type ATPase [Lysobacter sp.]